GIRGVVVTARAASLRREAEEALARRERRFRTLVQHASDLVLLIDDDRVVRYGSPAVERLLGRPLEGVTTAELAALVHPDDLDRARAVLLPGFDGAGPLAAEELRIRAGD